MKIHELTSSTTTPRKRVGRGIGSGYGKTAGRGTKGQNSRTGGGVRPGFEGGQNPLAKRLPKKRGFVPISQVTYQIVNLSLLETLKVTSVDAAALKAAGFIKNEAAAIKILGKGELTKKLNLKVHAASASAKAAVEKVGGSVEIIKLPVSPGKKRTRPEGESKSE